MLIGIERKFIFVANTKTASTSIESVLAPHAEVRHGGTPQRKHATLAMAAQLYPKLFAAPGQGIDDFFKFGVIRDPIDWIGSWYRYRKGNKVDSPLPADMDFATFWEQGDWNIRRGNGTPYDQSRMFCAADGTVMADVIIPYDRLEPMFALICDNLGLARPLPRENVSRLAQVDIPPDLRARLQVHYAADYALLARLDQINAAGMARLAARF